ncbi:hypothetical protein OAG12_01845 [Akkermansiaceae bacterium]|nr:hypothetical protein [Akkermansiaceae bacterium]MDB4772064.1 hypothetical protein [Akkermansiaceae bacterium]
MASDDEDEVLYYTDEEWWLIPLRERDEDALGFICNLVEVKDSESELLDYFDDDYSGRLPEWLMKRIKRYEVDHLLGMGEGSHGMYYGLYSLWDKEAKLGLLISASIDDKYPDLNSFHEDQADGLEASIRKCLRETFDHLEPKGSGKSEFDDICIFDPKYINSGIDKELKEFVRYLYDITEGGLMREKWPTAEDWIKEALPS